MNVTNFRSAACNADTILNVTKTESSIVLSLFGREENLSIHFGTEQLPALEKLVDELRSLQVEEARQKLARLNQEMQELKSISIFSDTSILQPVCIAETAEF